MRITLNKGKLNGLYHVKTTRYADDRGFLGRSFDTDIVEKETGIQFKLVQQSLQYSARKNILRGLHTQRSPMMETKFITCAAGTVLWVTVDVRKKSATFGQWESVELNPEGIGGLLIPGGFAHGCVSLTDGTLLVLNTDNPYSPDHGIGIAWDDPEIGIDWRVEKGKAQISEEHTKYPSFADFKKRYGGIE